MNVGQEFGMELMCRYDGKIQKIDNEFNRNSIVQVCAEDGHFMIKFESTSLLTPVLLLFNIVELLHMMLQKRCCTG